MAFLADRVKETTTTTGTGAITVSGAVAGYVSLNAAIGNGNKFYYCIVGQASTEWETGIATMTSSTTFTRDTVHFSSNSNSAVSFSAGTKDVFVTASATAIMNLLFTTYTDTDRTLVLNDLFTGIIMTSAAAHTLTVPPNSSVAFPLGAQIPVMQGGAGTVTIVAGAGVTINGNGLIMGGQNSLGALIKQATDTWLWTQWNLDLFSNRLNPSSAVVIPANCGVCVPDGYEIVNGFSLEVGDQGILLIE